MLAGSAGLLGVLASAACATSGDEGPRGSADVPSRPEPYGRGDKQYGEWTLPAGRSAAPVVVLVHGGFWQAGYGPDLERDVAAELGGRGFAVWNIDYRAADEPWPATFEDAAAALDHLPSSRHADRLDLGRVAVVGHSAGGHLALWLASRSRLPAGAPGAPGPGSVPVRLAVGQAPVADLTAAGTTADLHVLPGVGHFEHLDPASAGLRPVYRALATL